MGVAGKLGAIFQEYLPNNKSKLIADFQSDESWSPRSGCDSSNDTDNVRLGTKSIKCFDTSDVGSAISIELTSISLNLTQFESGAASDTSDYIVMVFYVNLPAYFTYVGVDFCPGTEIDLDNRYSYPCTEIKQGWNYVKIKKSAFTEDGTASWSAVQSMRAKAFTEDGSQTAGAYVSFQAIYLVDEDYELMLANNLAYICEQQGLVTGWSADSNLTLVEDSDLQTLKTAPNKTYTPTLSSLTVSSDKFWGDVTEAARMMYTYDEDDTAEAGTTTTNIKMTAHGLITGDLIVNSTRANAIRTVTKVDDDNITVTSVTSQTSGDTIKKYKRNFGIVVALCLYTNYAFGYRYECLAYLNQDNISLDKEGLIAQNVSFTGTTPMIYTAVTICDT